ncbi:MFS transporter [Altericroceibacterium endophyticum]|uniref:MFS transporter n=1 Tax=Altericroceibacterium endophyticum TaxID=1808508 RepID=A0A6I4T9A2_9SPHN|nr:MFS transporter [Altericroceibacterium endophyticum]MXO66731.1 MFS transporter [Altericroceibacterium endophyticum]
MSDAAEPAGKPAQPTVSNPVDRPSAALAIGAISGSGALIVSAAPVVVGALDSAFGFEQSQLGDIIFAYNAGFTLLVVAALLFIRHLHWRRTAFIASALVAGGFLVLPMLSSFASVAALFGAIGIAAGMLYALGMTIAGDSDNADRAFGLKLGMESVPSVLMLFFIPAVALPLGGLQAAAVTFAVLFVVLGLIATWLPARALSVDEDLDVEAALHHDAPAAMPGGKPTSAAQSLLALGASIIFVAGIAASWSFLELIAGQKGFSAGTTGLVLSIGFGVAALGGFIAAAIGTRFGRIVPMAGVFLFQAAGLALIGWSHDITVFTIGTFLLLSTINFGLAFLFGLSAELDASGRFVVLSATTLSVGGGIGPAIGGRLIQFGGLENVLMFSVGCSALTLAIFTGVARAHRARVLIAS